jgi:hypothetical protein
MASEISRTEAFFRTGRDLLHHPAHFFTLHARNDLSGGVGWVFHDLEREGFNATIRTATAESSRSQMGARCQSSPTAFHGSDKNP